MVLTILLTLLVFGSWIFISNKIVRNIVGTIFTLALLAMIIGITGHLSDNWGMEKRVVTSEEKEIYSAGNEDSPTNMLIANEIGKGTNNYVMAYKDNKNDKKPSTYYKPKTNKSDLSETIKKQAKYEVADVDRATKQTKKTIWVWKSDFYRMLFSFGSSETKLIKSTTTVKVPEDTWIVLNTDELKKLKQDKNKQMNSDDQEKQVQKIQSLAKKYKKQHPNASKKEIENHLEEEKEKIATHQLKKQLYK